METPTRLATTTLDRDGVTTIETKRWLMGTLYDEEDPLETVPSADSRHVASD